ncbi:MAG: hypothetical protein GX620_13845 [Chloroflexi bacterium]|nr:hypothetical protein [Chloroflexota bacterium]
MLALIAATGADLLLEQAGATRTEALGRMARAQEPFFWQVTGVMSLCPLHEIERRHGPRAGHNGIGGQAETWHPPVVHNGDGCSSRPVLESATLRFYASSVPGNGLGAFNRDPIRIVVEGGAQDGVGKVLDCGRVVILKGLNHEGARIDGSVGKGLGYRATGGTIIVQGNADSRACVRLSGADVIIGGEIAGALNDSLGNLGATANVKGFLCEYMTAERVLVVGDPGPWKCAGMTGGVLYRRLQPEFNLDWEAFQRRLAKGAQVELCPTDSGDGNHLHELIDAYIDELKLSNQTHVAQQVKALLQEWQRNFAKVIPLHSGICIHQ